MLCPFYRHDRSHGVCSIPDTLFDCLCKPENCEFEMGEWGAWRGILGAVRNAACVQELACARWNARRAQGDIIPDPGVLLTNLVAATAARIAYNAVGWSP